MSESVQTTRPITAIVLAAGEGKRMRSAIPKVAHYVAGRPMIGWVIHALRPLGCDRIVVVVGHGKDTVIAELDRHLPYGTEVSFVEQGTPLGTGHATKVAMEWLDEKFPEESGQVLVVNGDTPLISAETLAELVVYNEESDAAATILTAELEDPSGYGRLVRDEAGKVVRIVEEADCGPDEAAISEVNAGFYCFDRKELGDALASLSADNAQREYYLTDVIGYLVEKGKDVHAIEASAEEVLGVNNRIQLAEAERMLRERINRMHMASGVTIVDPATTYIGADVSIGRDTVILPGTLLEGDTSIGERCTIGPFVRIQDSILGPGCHVSFAVVVESQVGSEVSIGPFAHLRTGTRLADRVHIGTSVETKNAVVGSESKIPHLSYLGDAEVGSRVNVGAGTITCNYDGMQKHRTVIEDDARIGSDTMLVAPVRIGKGAYTAAGSAITVDVPDGALGVARQRQRNIEGWARRRRKASQEDSRQADSEASSYDAPTRRGKEGHDTSETTG
jgi:bifunctional UDP-N-acetylglucosamine pyrophosphorylase/glucosamine-1-phosphate N-acetyltransferase